jgi:hypothetical protein
MAESSDLKLDAEMQRRDPEEDFTLLELLGEGCVRFGRCCVRRCAGCGWLVRENDAAIFLHLCIGSGAQKARRWSPFWRGGLTGGVWWWCTTRARLRSQILRQRVEGNAYGIG